MEPIFLQPYLQEKIWGGNKLSTEFGLTIPSDKTGEAWMISAHPNGPSTIRKPQRFKGMTLTELYAQEPNLFGKSHPEPFPLLVKILDAQENLSIQVHPDDDYAKQLEGSNELGKSECWYVITAEEDATIIYGHHAKSKAEFKDKLESDDLNHLFRKMPVKAGDFFDVPPGTIHAIGAGITILEIQQSSDTTYRVFDYNRIDSSGNKRELHIKQSLEVSQIPHQDSLNNKRTTFIPDTYYSLIENDYFKVFKIDIINQVDVHLPENYYLVTVIDGTGTMTFEHETHSLKKADAFIIPYGQSELRFTGNLTIIASAPVINDDAKN